MKRTNKAKLQLNKLTVANLSSRELVKIQGGVVYNDGGSGGGGSGGQQSDGCTTGSVSLGSHGCQTGLCAP